MLVEIAVFFVFSILMSMVGLGGGVLYVPLLLFLGYGFQDASILSLFLIVVTGLSAFTRYSKANLVDWKLALFIELFTGLGAFAGGFTSVSFDEAWLRFVFAVALMIAAIFMLVPDKVNKSEKPVNTGFFYWKREFEGNVYSLNVLVSIPVFFIIGYVAGLLGISGGVFKIPLMILWFNIPVKIAVATSSLMVSLTGLLGLGGHLINEQPDWKFAVVLGTVVFLGAKIGSKVSINLPEKKVKTTMAFILFIMSGYMIIKLSL
jgi:uncharacterized membrane protein YfcA